MLNKEKNSLVSSKVLFYLDFALFWVKNSFNFLNQFLVFCLGLPYCFLNLFLILMFLSSMNCGIKRKDGSTQQKESMSVANPTKRDIIQAGFQALSDTLRLQIIELLQSQELCVCELCEKLDVKQSKLSFHLKILRDAELLCARQEGRWVYYQLNLAKFVILEQYLAEYRRFSPILPSRNCCDAS